MRQKVGEYKYHVQLVAFHITQVCSHKCPMCYSADDKRKVCHPALSKLIKVVDALAEGQVKELALLGGDPGRYPKVLEIAKYGKAKGMVVSILSNTLDFPGFSHEDVAQYISSFECTLHHYDPEIHDRFCRAKGAYKKVTTNLRKFAEIGCQTGIAINITPMLVGNIFKLVDSVLNREQIKLDYVIVQRIIPFGRAANLSNFTLSRNQVTIGLKGIRRVKKELGIKIIIEDPVPLCIVPDELKEFVTPCQWGLTKASVNAEGDLSRCGADPRYRLGNILEVPLLKIWNKSDVLTSFRNRKYLPGRCQVCSDLEKCGGGCALSCEIDKDHGLDYLYLEHEKIDKEIHGDLVFDNAKSNELSSILQIEWGNFAGYGHIFSVESLKKWFAYNPSMFWVVRDARKWVLGYATLTPITKALYNLITQGYFSSLTQFPECEVLTGRDTEYFHIEVLATVPWRTSSRTGIFLIKHIGESLLSHAKYVSTSPITRVGKRLCSYFEFKHVSDEKSGDRKYPIYCLKVNQESIKNKLRRF